MQHSKCDRALTAPPGFKSLMLRQNPRGLPMGFLFGRLPPAFGQFLRQRQRLLHRGGAELLGLRVRAGVDVRRGGNIAVARLFLNLLPMKRKNAGHGSGSIPGYSVPSLLGIRNSRPMVCCFGSPRRITMDSDSIFRALPYKKRIGQDRT